MKKILIILVLLMTAGILQSQTLDTASWELTKSSPTSYYDLAKNKIEYYGVGVGLLRVPIAYVIDDASTLDTTVWAIIRPYPTSYYNYITNIAEWYGYDSATVRIPFSFSVGEIGGSSFDADSMWVYLAANTIYDIGADSLRANNIVVDYGNFANWIWTPAIYSLNSTGAIKFEGTNQDTLGFYTDGEKQGYFDSTGNLILNRNLTVNTVTATTVTGYAKLSAENEFTGETQEFNKIILNNIDEGSGENGINTGSTFKPTGDDQCDNGSLAKAWRDTYTNDMIVKDSLTAVTGVFSGNATADTVHTNKLVIDNATEWIFGTGGTDRWVIDADGHFSPILDGTYDIGLTDYRVKMIYTDSLTVTEKINTKNISLTGTITGNTTNRDTNSFDNDAASDTVTVTGASVSDLYFIQTMGQTVNTADYCVVEPTATGFIVRRSASGTANLRYAWWRVK